MTEPISAHPLDDSLELGLAELCSAGGVTEQLVVDIVAEGIVEPRGADPRAWRFTGIAIARIRRVAGDRPIAILQDLCGPKLRLQHPLRGAVGDVPAGTNVNDYMVRAGLAVAYDGGAKA